MQRAYCDICRQSPQLEIAPIARSKPDPLRCGRDPRGYRHGQQRIGVAAIGRSAPAGDADEWRTVLRGLSRTGFMSDWKIAVMRSLAS
jgi:hypothetical protein